jgi:hypothetical protein
MKMHNKNNKNDGQTNNNDINMNNPQPNPTPDQPTNHNQENAQAAPPTDSTATSPNPGQPIAGKTKKELQLYRSIEELCGAGLKLVAYLRKRPYLSADDLYLSMEMLYPASVSLVSNQQLIYVFWKEGAYRVKKKTMMQYLTHLRQFAKAINKAFYLVTPLDVARYVRERTIVKTPKGDIVKQATHDHTIDILANFFNFLLNNGYYPRLLPNPVQIRRIGNKRRAPSQSCIFTVDEFQRLLDALPWYLVPAAICMFRLGIRPETIPRLSWEDFDWARKIVNVSQVINKAGAAYPILNDTDLALFKDWMHCTGPLAVPPGAVAEIYETARRLKIRKNFKDDGRKTSISMRGAVLWELDREDVEAKLNREFGNSSDVRTTFYECPRSADEGVAYSKVTRSLPDQVITAKFAREYRMAQMRAAVRIAIAISEAKHEHTYTTDPSTLNNLRRAALKKAWESLSKDGAFPTFIKFTGEAELSNAHLSRLVKHMEREVAQVLNSLNEIYANDPDGQLSVFHGQAELFLPESAISEECPPTTSSPKPSSPSDTESQPEL